MKYRFWRLGMPVLFLGAAAVLGWVVMMLWNAVVPVAFVGGRLIDYWHALGLLVLSRILFGGFRGRGGWRGRHRRRWEAMTPEEREQLKQSYAMRCGRREGSA
jgi:hypothetical protein